MIKPLARPLESIDKYNVAAKVRLDTSWAI